MKCALVGVASSRDNVAARCRSHRKTFNFIASPAVWGYLQDRVEVTASDKRRERIEVMTITEWIIQLSIFGVLALAVVGTVQNLVDAMRKKN